MRGDDGGVSESAAVSASAAAVLSASHRVEREREVHRQLPISFSASLSTSFLTLSVDDGILIMWKTAERLFWISLTLRPVPPGLF
ncbi:hypothetical protein OJAV_G00016070 [Oryzias javanicus]|uniref:Uncharacterized protein n=1 Tax=Oryzias javanicus TaxID=123683 RepID=A0A3S2MGD9_ORYJA|nr:hypothetical protein OJAV_G00016070 [Oryzias javanicus]